MKEIESREDIICLINTFYDKVKNDQTIGYFFSDVAKVDWDKHLPIMYDFWESVTFSTNTYTGNPMIKHLALNAKSTMTTEHFKQWYFLFEQTVNELFIGEKAELIKQRAMNISTIMQMKIIG